MKSILIAVAAAGSLVLATSAVAQSGEELFDANKCAKCHAPDSKKKGPSLADMRAKPSNPAEVLTKLKEGLDKHPKIKVPDDEIKAMIKFAQTGK